MAHTFKLLPFGHNRPTSTMAILSDPSVSYPVHVLPCSHVVLQFDSPMPRFLLGCLETMHMQDHQCPSDAGRPTFVRPSCHSPTTQKTQLSQNSQCTPDWCSVTGHVPVCVLQSEWSGPFQPRFPEEFDPTAPQVQKFPRRTAVQQVAQTGVGTIAVAIEIVLRCHDDLCRNHPWSQRSRHALSCD